MFARARPRPRRGGFVAIEAAVVYPTFLALVVGGVVLGLGIFRRQEVAHLARESARWAALQDPAMRTPEQIRANVLAPKAVGVNPAAMTVATTSTAESTSVTIEYAWTPEAYIAPITFTCKARVRNPY